MQVVTLEDLKQLLPEGAGQQVDESFFFKGGLEGIQLSPDLTFKDVCKAYGSMKQHADELLAATGTSKKAWRGMVHDQLRDHYLKSKCPPIKLVGSGSSRTAYACLGGMCLKVAKSEAGAAQSQQELKHTKKRWWKPAIECFVQSYGATKDYGLLLTECCAKIDSGDKLAELLGFSSNEDVLRGAVKSICQSKNLDLAEAADDLRVMARRWRHDGEHGFSSMLTWADVAEASAESLETLLELKEEKMTPGQRSFMQIVQFWKKHGVDELLPGDVDRAENWGIAIRRGQLTPVMVDVGFSDAVSSKYYHQHK